jgi:CRISPR-associated protein Csx3
MAQPIFKIAELTDANGVVFRSIEFEIPGGVTSPPEFAAAVTEIASRLAGKLPILLNGRGPVWGYGMLLHVAHPTPAVATFDPRLGYVVVQSHDSRFEVGQILTGLGEVDSPVGTILLRQRLRQRERNE